MAGRGTLGTRARYPGSFRLRSRRRTTHPRTGKLWIREVKFDGHRLRETLAIAGYAVKEGRFNGLYLDRRDGDRIMDAGKVEHGFSDHDAREIIKRLDQLKQARQPYDVKVKKPKAVWAQPKLSAEIEYRTRTSGGKLRHPSFKGIRQDI